MKIKKTSICCFFIAIFLSGCWDTVDIENRGFVIGVAIDEPEDNTKEENAFLITNQTVVPSQMARQEGGSGGETEAFYNLSREGTSVYKTAEEFAGSSSKIPYYEHLMLVLLSKETAERDGAIVKALDSLIRSPQVRRNIKVVITKDRAVGMLDFVTPDEPLPAMHLQQLLAQSNKQAGFFTPKSLGDVDELLLTHKSFALPLLTKQKDYVDYNSLAIYQGEEKRVVGTFDKEEKTGLDFYHDEAVAHIFDFDLQDEPMAFRVVKQSNQFKLDVSDTDHIKVKVDINLEGGLREAYSDVDLGDEAIMNAIEQAASKKVEHLVEQTIEKGQKELNADIFKVWRMVEKQHYSLWKKIRDDWEKGENHFSNVSFDVNVDVELNSTGTSKKTD